ncbi:heme peroxidase, partial [Cynara cardunculus var. scolymus]
ITVVGDGGNDEGDELIEKELSWHSHHIQTSAKSTLLPAMAAKNTILSLLFGLVLLGVARLNVINALSSNYYDQTCPQAESTVTSVVKKAMLNNRTVTTALLRMHFHDCFIRGCDASVLLNSTGKNKAEKDGPPNISLHAFYVIDKAKKAVKVVCPKTVSCTDILALAARDAVTLVSNVLLDKLYVTHFMYYDVKIWNVMECSLEGRHGMCRKEERMEEFPRQQKHDSYQLQLSTFPSCNRVFSQRGLSMEDLVALSGGHTLGFAHFSSFQNRIHNFASKQSIDPTLRSSFAASLKRSIFSSDQSLVTMANTKALVSKFANSRQEFEKAFVKSMIKMSSINGGQEKPQQLLLLYIKHYYNKDFSSPDLLTPSCMNIYPYNTLSFSLQIPKLSLHLLHNIQESPKSTLRPTMAAKNTIFSILFGLVLLGIARLNVINALSSNYYDQTCPQAESAITSVVKKAMLNDRTVPAALLRMHFHDCFIRGCDASVLLNSTGKNKAEKDGPPNISLHAFYVIDNAKKAVEASGGPTWDVPKGRKDGRISKATETRQLPAPTFNISQLQQSFSQRGLSMKDLVALSGGHTLGFAHCSSFQNRIHNFASKQSVDPTLKSSFAASLKRVCPAQNTVKNAGANLDSTPTTFDNRYYKLLLQGKSIFSSDQSLVTMASTKAMVSKFASSRHEFEKAFVKSMIKMSSISGGGQEVRIEVYYFKCNCQPLHLEFSAREET